MAMSLYCLIMDATFTKTQSGLIPANTESEEWYNSVKSGSIVTGKFSKKQNSAFHRKMFALLKLGFENWKQPEVMVEVGGRSILPEKEFVRFRKDITILAGFYHTVFRVDGSFRIEADSLSYDKMSPEKREAIYSKFIDVLLKNVYQDLNSDDVDKLVEAYLPFA